MNFMRRDCDDPFKYETEMQFRVHPDELQKMGSYTLRFMREPGTEPFATDFATLIMGVERQGDLFVVKLIWQPQEDEGPKEIDFDFNDRGLMVLDTRDEPRILADQIESGYFVRPFDPCVAEFAVLAAQELPRLAG